MQNKNKEFENFGGTGECRISSISKYANWQALAYA